MEQRYQCLGDVELETFVGVVIHRKGVTVVQIFELPFAEPDEIFLGHLAVFHDFPYGHGALKTWKRSRAYFFRPAK